MKAVSEQMVTEASGQGGQGKSSATAGRGRRPEGSLGIRIYKPSQGFYTRVGTAIGAGILSLGGAMYLFDELAGTLDQGWKYTNPILYGSAVGFLVLMGLVIYWIVGLNAKANDFFIATEGEMKKVSWTSTQDVIRSTKVVIVTVIVMSIFLFAADLLFMMFFSQIGVLKGAPSLFKIFGIGS